MKYLIKNFFTAARQVFIGNTAYYLWIAFLSVFILLGLSTYIDQLQRGLITTAMRDQVSWGFYISNFTFLVGVAAAAVLLVIPAYLYNFKPIKEIVLFGELLAITAITMCILFIMVDMGQPLRVWHILPVVGTMNFPCVAPGLGRGGPERVPRDQHGHRVLRALPPLHREGVQDVGHRAAHHPVHPLGREHPYRNGVPL